MPRVIKADANREMFDEQKLRGGFQRALEKRPVSMPDIDRAIARIKRKILGSGEREIASRQLGEWVMEALRDLDHVAYIRFASVYRHFEDVAQFREVIERLEEHPQPASPQLPLLDPEPPRKRGRRK